MSDITTDPVFVLFSKSDRLIPLQTPWSNRSPDWFANKIRDDAIAFVEHMNDGPRIDQVRQYSNALAPFTDLWREARQAIDDENNRDRITDEANRILWSRLAEVWNAYRWMDDFGDDEIDDITPDYAKRATKRIGNAIMRLAKELDERHHAGDVKNAAWLVVAERIVEVSRAVAVEQQW